jgi:septal ring factor EnvC (AmiA/AmiB activator)
VPRQRQPDVIEPLPIEIPKSVETEQMAGAGLAAKVFRMTEDQLEKARDIAAWAKDVEARISKEQKRAGELEEQNAALRETAMSTAAHVLRLEMELGEEQKRSSILLQRVAETEHAAACAYRLAEIVAEIGRLGPKP